MMIRLLTAELSVQGGLSCAARIEWANKKDLNAQL
jgi:hypothetical protein